MIGKSAHFVPAITVVLFFNCLFSVRGSAQGAERTTTTFDLQTSTVADINAAIDAGALSSEKLVCLDLNRIEAYDKK